MRTSTARLITRFFLLTCAALAAWSAMSKTTVGDDQTSTESRADAIKQMLSQQAEAWNRGDIDAFMEFYWKSDQLTFSSGGNVTRGWQATKDSYKRRYATREQMGVLTFDRLEVQPLGDAAALVLGRWKLKRKSDPIGGVFSLVLRRMDGKWRIIHDHTSRNEPSEND